MTQSDGGTPLTEHEQAEVNAKMAECMGRWKHAKVHVWDNGVWTNKLRCTTCGKTFDKNGKEIEA